MYLVIDSQLNAGTECQANPADAASHSILEQQEWTHWMGWTRTRTWSCLWDSWQYSRFWSGCAWFLCTIIITQQYMFTFTFGFIISLVGQKSSKHHLHEPRSLFFYFFFLFYSIETRVNTLIKTKKTIHKPTTLYWKEILIACLSRDFWSAVADSM